LNAKAQILLLFYVDFDCGMGYESCTANLRLQKNNSKHRNKTTKKIYSFFGKKVK
tara:strand:- start:40 stop:204 length:165 start_codon:yes stop_codon:yes gene_type:complete